MDPLRDLAPHPDHLQTRAHPVAPLVSVVVTTYAMERLNDVQELLDSLAAQTYPKMEILFVAERMRELADRVRHYADHKGITNLQVVFHEGGGGLSRSRNLGVGAARGNIIAFIDDDAVAEADWVEEIVDVLAEHPSTIGVTGGALPLWEDASMNWFPEEFFWIISCPVPAWTGVVQLQPVRNAWGINMAFRREAFERCQFSETFGVSNRGVADGIKLGLVGDDTEFCLQLRHQTGRPILFNPRCRVFHKIHRRHLSPRFTRRRAFWEGYTKATIGRWLSQNGGENRPFLLSNELTVFRRTVFSLLPRLARQFATDPVLASRGLVLTLDVLLHFGLGYAAARLPWPGGPLVRRYSR